MALGLRGRLLAVFLTMMAIAALGSTALFSRLLAVRSLTSLDRYLERRGREFVATLGPGRANLKDFPAAGTTALEKAGYDPAELAGLLRLPDGHITATQPALRLEEGPQARDLLARGSGVGWTQTSRGRARLAAHAVDVGESAPAVFLLARFTDPIDRNRGEVVRLFLGVLFGSLSLASIAGYFLAGRALRPLRDITRTARLISREDLSRRITFRGHQDEVGQLAATFNEMLGRLEAAFTEQQRFLSDVSHELRTPMQVIKGHLEVLQRLPHPTAAESRATLTLVLDEVNRMARLTGQLLTLARSAGALTRTSVPARPFLEEIVRKAGTLGSRRFTLEAEEITIPMNRDALTQILLNLVQNAVENTAPQDRITVGAAGGGEEIRLWVADTGRGIAEEALPHIFERFFRVGEDGGSGLGLAIVDALVRAHGGQVKVESQVGRGTKVEIILPRE